MPGRVRSVVARLREKSSTSVRPIIGIALLTGACGLRRRGQSHATAVLLWVINKMLFELRDDLKTAAAFLDTWHRCVESHDEPSPFGSGNDRRKVQCPSLRLKPFTVTAMVAHVSCSYLRGTEPGYADWRSQKPSQDRRPLLHFWENIDMGKYVDLCV